MNYFAHARLFLDQPYLVVGTAVPDWLRVVDKRLRARAKQATHFLEHHGESASREEVAISQGILQHHSDDHWFHTTPAFVDLNLRFSRELVERFAGEDSLRANFVGHVAIELLLDAALIDRQANQLATYYRILDQVDHSLITRTVESLLGRPVPQLERWIRRFAAERFLYDYAEDERLRRRLDQVMSRVGLAPLPPRFTDWLATAREAVCRQADALLVPDSPIDGEQTTL